MQRLVCNLVTGPGDLSIALHSSVTYLYLLPARSTDIPERSILSTRTSTRCFISAPNLLLVESIDNNITPTKRGSPVNTSGLDTHRLPNPLDDDDDDNDLDGFPLYIHSDASHINRPLGRSHPPHRSTRHVEWSHPVVSRRIDTGERGSSSGGIRHRWTFCQKIRDEGRGFEEDASGGVESRPIDSRICVYPDVFSSLSTGRSSTALSFGARRLDVGSVGSHRGVFVVERISRST